MKSNILVIGLGYVGLPLALSLSKYYNVFGFDISKKRVNELKRGYDCNKETSKNLILKSKIKFFYDDKEYDYKTNVFIVTVPTPVNAKNKPNLKSLISACKFISKKVKKNDLIII